jgi:CubicO group peptidase (beta-lactamase class C family)
MNKILLLSLLLVFASITAAQNTDELWKVVSDKINGSSVARMYVIIGDARGTVFKQTKGDIADGTQLVIASASKWMSTLVIMNLIEEGTLSLSMKPSEVIPWWTNDQADNRTKVTVQHLLSFQSGFNTDNACLVTRDMELEACAKSIYDTGVETEPGTAFYDGGNHLQLLGFLAQNKTGKSWTTLFDDYVKKPLGIFSGYNVGGSGNNPGIAGGITASVPDYAKFVRGLFMKTILDAATIDLMEQDSTGSATIDLSPANQAGLGWRFALGNYVECNSATWKDSCNTDMHIRSSFGSFGFYAWLDRKMEYYGVLGTTVSTGTDSAKFIDSIRADIEAALATLPPVSVTPPTGSTQPTNVNNPNAQTSSASIEIRTFAVCLLALLVLAL